jgi:hypothetical protein
MAIREIGICLRAERVNSPKVNSRLLEAFIM